MRSCILLLVIAGSLDETFHFNYLWIVRFIDMVDVTTEHSMTERHKEIQQTHQAIKLRHESPDKVCLLLKCENALTFV